MSLLFAKQTWGSVLVTGWMLHSATFARAQGLPIVVAPCGDRERFLREVDALRPEGASAANIERVTISAASDGSHRLELQSPDGLRTMTDGDCETLFKTAVVIVATWSEAIGPPEADDDDEPARSPLAESRSSQAGSAATPSSDSTSAQTSSSEVRAGGERTLPPPRAKVTSEPSRSSARPSSSGATSSLFAGGGAGAFHGLTPEPSFGMELLTGLHRGHWGADLALRLLPPHTWKMGDFGVRQTVWGARLAGSLSAVPRLKTTVGISGYWIGVRGTGNLEPASDGVGLLAPEVELAIALVETGSWRGELAVQARVGLNSPRFVVAPGIEVYELSRWGVAGLLRILWDGS